MPSGRLSVSSADFIRNVGHWQSEALRQPIAISHHGRDRLVLATPAEFERGAQSVDAEARSRASDADIAIETLEEGYLAFDAALRLKRINRAADAFIGQSRDALIGTLAQDLAPLTGPALCDRLERVMRTRKTESFEVSITGRRLSMRVFPLTEGVGLLFANTSEQYDQRERLGVDAAFWAATSLIPRLVVVRLDLRGRVSDAHDGFGDLLGFHRNELLVYSLFHLVLPEHADELREAFEKTLTGGSPQQVCATLVGKQAKTIGGVFTLAPIRVDGANTAVLLLIATEAAAPAQRA